MGTKVATYAQGLLVSGTIRLTRFTSTSPRTAHEALLNHTATAYDRKQSQMRRIARSQMRRQKTLPTDAQRRLPFLVIASSRPARGPPHNYYHTSLTTT